MELLIVAKQPRPGFAKTRLIPALGPEGAATLATAALLDTFDAAAASRADRVVVAFDGDPTDLVPSSFEVVPQPDGPFDLRLADAWRQVTGPALQIGMDTPQVTAADLDLAFATLDSSAGGAVLGPALDGGWWALGMVEPDPSLLEGVPTSTEATGEVQATRLRTSGRPPTLLARQRDLDEPEDIGPVARSCAQGSRFALAVAALSAAAGAATR